MIKVRLGLEKVSSLRCRFLLTSSGRPTDWFPDQEGGEVDFTELSDQFVTRLDLWPNIQWPASLLKIDKESSSFLSKNRTKGDQLRPDRLDIKLLLINRLQESSYLPWSGLGTALAPLFAGSERHSQALPRERDWLALYRRRRALRGESDLLNQTNGIDQAERDVLKASLSLIGASLSCCSFPRSIGERSYLRRERGWLSACKQHIEIGFLTERLALMALP